MFGRKRKPYLDSPKNLSLEASEFLWIMDGFIEYPLLLEGITDRWSTHSSYIPVGILPRIFY